MSDQENSVEALEFPQRRRSRLRVSIKSFDAISGHSTVSQNRIRLLEDGTIEGLLLSAQQEVVEQEIFTVLVREAPNLHTATARVSERLIAVDAVQDMELIFELVCC
jgi:mediator of RNA polymerase II transcription subunit 17, fungi type